MIAKTTIEYSTDFTTHNFRDIFFFHRINPVTRNNTDHTIQGININISLSPAPKSKILSEIKYTNIGVKISGVNKVKNFFKNMQKWMTIIV